VQVNSAPSAQVGPDPVSTPGTASRIDRDPRTGEDLIMRTINKPIILLLLCLAQFMVVLDVAIVNVALPSIQTDLHIGADAVQWVIIAYGLTLGGFLLLGGRAADLLGRRSTLITGLVIFTAASLLAGLSGSSEVLIAARAVQGFGAACRSGEFLAWGGWCGRQATWDCTDTRHQRPSGRARGPGLLRVRCLLPGEHRDELSDLALTGCRALHGSEAVDQANRLVQVSTSNMA
jgi:hypothetical protein